MVTQQRMKTGAFLVGVGIYFTLKTTLESVYPFSRPAMNLPEYIGFNLLLSILINLIIGTGTQFINDRLEQRLQWHEAVTKRLVVQALITGLFALVLVSLFAAIVHYWVVQFENPRNALLRAIVVGSLFAMVMSVFYTAVYFYEQWGRSLLKAEQLKRQNLQSQFIALKNQISPHFLFNSLSTLSSLIGEDQKLASTFVQNLASVYRYVLQSMDSALVALATELQAAQSYIFLQQSRFGDNLRVHVRIPEEYEQLCIVPFTIQILLENAIKHNIVSNEKPLTIEVVAEGGNVLVVKNTLQRKQSVEASAGVGLRNMVKRYDLLGRKDVVIRETETEFIVSIPLLRDERC